MLYFICMKRSLFLTFLLCTALLPGIAQAKFSFDPEFILSDYDLTNPFSMDLNQIQQFLERGSLADYVTEDWEGVERKAADIIWRASQFNGINPKFLLVLLQKEQSLIEDDDPSDNQLDWATGYAVCDNCSKSDPAIQRWKGFGKQINSASLQFIEGYLADIEATGSTQGKYGPGIDVEIDDQIITPKNAATAALYAYTPHIHGNENFAKIWNRWFRVLYPTGSLIKAVDSPDVYLIEYGYKRPIHSWSAFVSRYNPDLILEVAPTELANYPDGRPIDFPNYSLLEDEDGQRYLLVNDTLRPFDSNETYRSIGFSEDELVDIENADLAYYDMGHTITRATTDPQGSIIQLETNGAMFFVQDGYRHAILDPIIKQARFPNTAVIKASPVAVEQYREASPVLMPDGWLVKGSEPTVYVISEGLKRPIPSEEIFTSIGFEWTNIVTIDQSVLDLHDTGAPLEADEATSTIASD